MGLNGVFVFWSARTEVILMLLMSIYGDDRFRRLLRSLKLTYASGSSYRRLPTWT